MKYINIKLFIYEISITIILICQKLGSVGSADLVTFTKEILNGKLHFLCSDLSFPITMSNTTFKVCERFQYYA